MQQDYPRYNVYMKVNTPDHLKSIYRSLENAHNAFANPEDCSYEDLGTWERILCEEIMKVTDGSKAESVIEKRNQARKLRDQIVVLKKEDHKIHKKLKPGIKNVGKREELLSKSREISVQISTHFEALHAIHKDTVKE